MRNTSYRLNEYKIIENEFGDLSWESHAGFCSFKNGKCFLKGNILFLEPGSTGGSGFLKREFFEEIETLPSWEKSRYYCTGHIIHECKSGLKANMLFQDSIRMKHNEIVSNAGKAGCCKLDKYIITAEKNGQMCWESYGMSSTNSGTCFVESDILFIEPGKIGKSDFKKKEFQNRLENLPEWEQSRYYCSKYTMYPCFTGNKPHQSRKQNRTVVENISGKKPEQRPDNAIKACAKNINILRMDKFKIPAEKADEIMQSLVNVKENISDSWKSCKKWLEKQALNKKKLK